MDGITLFSKPCDVRTDSAGHTIMNDIIRPQTGCTYGLNIVHNVATSLPHITSTLKKDVCSSQNDRLYKTRLYGVTAQKTI